jgi:hypothetical protein
MKIKQIFIICILILFFNELKSQKLYSKQFFINSYYKNDEDYAFNLDYEEESDLLIGTIIKISTKGMNEGFAIITIMFTNPELKGKSTSVIGITKNNKTKGNESLNLIEKMKVGAKIKFKTVKMGNGLGRSFWFTQVQI